MADRTKIWIADTVKKLLVQKPIEKIRVTEICRAAEIDQPTFYYHFMDKYELIRFACTPMRYSMWTSTTMC